MSSLLTELKRRNVLRVAAAYAVVAWIIIEAGSVLLPTFGASETAFKVYVVVVILGFVASLIFAWIFELTPEGVKLEKNVDRSRSVTVQTGRRLDFIIIGLLVVALGISVSLNVTGIKEQDSVPANDRLSIAVLPFQSRSTEPENDIFADGIHDDLLTRLANVGALKVISRTSVLEYRDTTKNLRQIGEELGVGTVIEGTVQRIGDNVRINAQLIDATTDEHIWAKSYDRQLNMQNIFAIQSEISEEITLALKATLTAEEQIRITNVPTENLNAYRLYMRGRANLYERRLETLLEARTQFEQAVGLDPDFAEAHAALAESVLLLFNNHNALTREEALTVARKELDTALALDPELADAYASLGLLKQKVWEETRTGPELTEAEAAFRRAIELNPNHPSTYMWFGSLRTMQQRVDEAIDLYHQALRLDPLNRIPYANLPGLYAALGENEKALEHFVEAVRLHPEWPTAYQNLAGQLQTLGRFDEAFAWALRANELSTDPLIGATLVGLYVEFGDYGSARDMVAALPSDHPLHELQTGAERVLDGDFGGAAEAFEEVVARSDNPRQFLFYLIATFAAKTGDYDKARTYIERANPEFTADADLEIDRFNVAGIVLYAFTLKKLGEEQRAGTLLDGALELVRTLPRVGVAGHGIRDVEILALQGKTFEALAALRDAIDAGFRGTVATNGWPLDFDPYLDSIRDRPEFEAMVEEIDDAVFEMQQRVALAQTTGDWSELMALADGG